MVLLDLIDLITSNLGITWADLILVLLILVSLLFFAVDFRMGTLILFLFSSLFYVILTQWNIESFKFLVVMGVSLTILALSLYVSHSKGINTRVV